MKINDCDKKADVGTNLYLENAMANLGTMFEYANIYDGSLETFVQMFIASGVAYEFEVQNPKYIVGMSGYEIYLDVLQRLNIDSSMRGPETFFNKSHNYWCGWMLAYLQWQLKKPFKEILIRIPIFDFEFRYNVLHTVDLKIAYEHFVELYQERLPKTKLKIRRELLELTRENLAKLSGLSLSTIGAYEQRSLDINNASYANLQSLARVLKCDIEDIVEMPYVGKPDADEKLEYLLSEVARLNAERANIEKELYHLKAMKKMNEINSKAWSDICQKKDSADVQNKMTYADVQDKLIKTYQAGIKQAGNDEIKKRIENEQKKRLIETGIREGISLYLKASGQKEASIIYDAALLATSKSVLEASFQMCKIVLGVIGR